MFLRNIESLSGPKADLLSYLYVSLSNLCNARCVYCDVHSAAPPVRRYGSSEVQWILGSAKQLGCTTVHFLGGGEPLIDPRFAAAAECCCELGLGVVITTNGSHIVKQLQGPLGGARLETLVVSLDSHRAEVHDRVRGMRGLWDQAVDGIGYARCHSPHARIVVNHVLTCDNASSLPLFVSFAAQLGASGINVIPVKDRVDLMAGSTQSLPGRLEEARSAARDLGMELLCEPADVADWNGRSTGLAASREYRCLFPYHALYVDFPSGEVFPCDCTVHRDPRGRFVLGSIWEQPLEAIWHGAPIRKLRSVLETPCDPGCKRDCDWNNMRTNSRLFRVLESVGQA